MDGFSGCSAPANPTVLCTNSGPPRTCFGDLGAPLIVQPGADTILTDPSNSDGAGWRLAGIATVGDCNSVSLFESLFDQGAHDFLADSPPPSDTTPPETTIDKPPKRKMTKRKARKAKVEFSSDDPKAHFQCRLDDHPFVGCSSPQRLAKLGKLKKGRHRIEIRAIDVAGNVDASPAEAMFKVTRKRHRA
jgi:hypothetical protein